MLTLFTWLIVFAEFYRQFSFLRNLKVFVVSVVSVEGEEFSRDEEFQEQRSSYFKVTANGFLYEGVLACATDVSVERRCLIDDFVLPSVDEEEPGNREAKDFSSTELIVPCESGFPTLDALSLFNGKE